MRIYITNWNGKENTMEGYPRHAKIRGRTVGTTG